MTLSALPFLRALALPAAGLLALSGCTGGGQAPSATSAPAAPTPAVPEAAKPAPADKPADTAKDPAAKPAAPADTAKKDPAPAKAPEPPKPLPPASPESVAKVKALMNRMDSEAAEEREAAWKDLRDMGDLATPALVGVLKEGKASERRNAAKAIGLLKDKAAADALRAALADTDAEVRWHSARALGELADTASRDPLIKLVKEDKDADVREHAAYALANMGVEDGFTWFREELKAPEASRRSRAVKALGKYGREKYIPDLAGALKDKEARVRTEVVIQLGDIRHKDTVEPLIAALGDEEYKIRERARSALEKLTLVDDLGSDKAKWEEWWAESKAKFKVSATGKPDPHAWENAVAIKGDADYKKNVEESKGLVALIVHVPAAPDSIRASRALDKLAAALKGKLVVCAAEAQPNMATVRRLGIKEAPTVIVYQDGKRLETVVGAKTAAEYKTVLEEHVAGTRKIDEEKEKALRPPDPYAWKNAVAIKGDADYKKLVDESKGLVAVVFHVATPDCIKVGPGLDKLATRLQGKLTICEAEAQANMATVRKLGLKEAPTVIVYKDGKRLETVAGAKDDDEYKTILEEHIAGTRKVDEEKEKALQPAPKPVPEFPDVKDAAEFKAKVEESKGLVLVDFHADWCGWCHKLTPILNKLAKDYQGKLAIVGIDADANPKLKERFGVEGLPTLLVFRDGKLAETLVGFKPEEELKKILDGHVAGTRKVEAEGAAK
ncbi:MAG TPA: thioredoxin domain-containing protein [Planctomycetota bacterium]|nr:thioredoxin domain-containing protein [Planctomycetota bacterium]